MNSDPVITVHELGDNRWQWQVVVIGEVVARGINHGYEDALREARAHQRTFDYDY